MSPNNVDLFEALLAGASGYLLKDMSAARLPTALCGVLAGEAALPGALERRRRPMLCTLALAAS